MCNRYLPPSVTSKAVPWGIYSTKASFNGVIITKSSKFPGTSGKDGVTRNLALELFTHAPDIEIRIGILFLCLRKWISFNKTCWYCEFCYVNFCDRLKDKSIYLWFWFNPHNKTKVRKLTLENGISFRSLGKWFILKMSTASKPWREKGVYYRE